MSPSAFLLIQHQPILFHTLLSIFVILSTYFSLHKLFPSHIFVCSFASFFCTKYAILDIVRHYYFCYQNVMFTFTTIVGFEERKWVGVFQNHFQLVYIFVLTGNCTVCTQVVVNVLVVFYVMHNIFQFVGCGILKPYLSMMPDISPSSLWILFICFCAWSTPTAVNEFSW